MLNYIIYRLGQFIALAVPLRFSYKIAAIFSDVHYFFAFADRKTTKENLEAIFPQKSQRQINDIRKRMFRNFAKYLVDFFRFSKIDNKYIGKMIKVENRHFIDEALKSGRGVILLSGHLGNWELGALVVSLLGYPLWVVALPHKHKPVDDFFNRQRKSKGVEVIPFGRAARMCLSVLKDNKLLALVGDRDFSERGEVVEFFGKKTFLPAGPAYFASKLGSVIVPVFMYRNADDSFTLKIEKPIYNTVSIDSYKAILEDYIRRYADQWYMFRKFWIE